MQAMITAKAPQSSVTSHKISQICPESLSQRESSIWKLHSTPMNIPLLDEGQDRLLTNLPSHQIKGDLVPLEYPEGESPGEKRGQLNKPDAPDSSSGQKESPH